MESTRGQRTWAQIGARRYVATAVGAVVLAVGAFAPVAAQAAAPKTLYVSQGGFDSGACTAASPCATVSYALTKAASGATIEVSGTINGILTIASPVTITTWPGGPAGSPAVLDGTASGIVITVDTGVTGVTLNDLTIENGAAYYTSGITNDGTLTLTDSTVSGNSAGGITNNGTMTVTDSTIAANTGDGIDNNGVTTIIASTISANTGIGISGGGGGTATLAATIVADNTSANCYGQDAASLASAGYNLTNDKTGTACAFDAATDLVNKNPLLGSLTNNGGPTETMLPGSKSPAANVIPKTTTLRGVTVCPSTDQRGDARPGRGETRCTIGAVEAGYNSPTTTAVTLNPATVTAGTRVVYLAVVSPNSGTGTPTGTISFSTGGTTLCTAVLSGGVAACGATTAPVGTDTVTGTYAGGDGYATSSGTATLTVTSG